MTGQRDNEELRRENESLRSGIVLLNRIGALVDASLELEPTCYAVLTGVTAGVGLGLNRAMLFLTDDDDRTVMTGAGAVGPDDRTEADRVWRSIESTAPDLETLYEAGLRQVAHRSNLDLRVRRTTVDAEGDSPLALALRDGLVAGGGTDDLDGLLHIPTAVAAPLRTGTTLRGVLYGDNCFLGNRLDPVSQLLFGLIADQAGRAIDNARRFEQLAHEARTDALTGLGHHGALMEELNRAVELAQRDGQPLGLAMVDLDDFKRVNDTYGHLAGDALLAGISARMREVVRVGEKPFRYGGEEFAVILPNSDGEMAAAVGERIREAVGGRPFNAGAREDLAVTCSVGVASLPHDATDAQGLVAVADSALLRAKACGKNVVVKA